MARGPSPPEEDLARELSHSRSSRTCVLDCVRANRPSPCLCTMQSLPSTLLVFSLSKRCLLFFPGCKISTLMSWADPERGDTPFPSVFTDPINRHVLSAERRPYARSGLGPCGEARKALSFTPQISHKLLWLVGLWNYKITFGEQGSALVGTDVNQIIRGTNTYTQLIWLFTDSLFMNSSTH